MSDNPNAFALLTGIGDYRTFDPTGQSDLAGPINDVIGWWHIARDLGIPPQNIRICVAPGLPPDVLGRGIEHAMVTGANRAEVEDGLAWLAKMLDGTDGTKALLTWSGHGTRVVEGQVLCPADVYAAGQTLENGLLIDRVRALLDQRHPATRITAFVDTCHTETGFDTPAPARGRGLRWPGAAATPKQAADNTPHRAFGDLVVTSSEVGTVSYEMPVIGGVRGAFSWAASNLIRRYGLAQAAGGTTSGLSFHDLAQRCGQILSGMMVEQTPRYVGVSEGGDLRVFSTFGDDAWGSVDPQTLGGQEIWPAIPDTIPAVRYELTAESAQGGDLYLTSSKPPSGWAPNAQYWDWGAAGWPKADFTATYKGQDNIPSSPQGTGFATSGLTAGSGNTVTIDAAQGPVYETTGQNGTGYFKYYVAEDQLQVISAATGITTLAKSYGEDLSFTYTSSDVHLTENLIAVDPALS